MWSYIKKAINSDFATEPLNTKTDRIETDTQDIQTQVGSDSDSASASGSVHAKLKYLENEIRYRKWNLADYYNASPATSTFYVILNYTGNGKLCKIIAYDGASVEDLTIRVTLDGVAKTYTPNAGISWGTQSGIQAFLIPMTYFNSSCKVEVSTTTTVNIGSTVEYLTD